MPAASPPAFWRALSAVFEKAARGQASTIDLNDDGELITLHVAPLLTSDEIEGYLVVTPNAQEKRKIEVLAERSGPLEQRSYVALAAAFDNAQIGMSITDFDLHWLRVNQAYCDLLGYERDELLSMTVSEVTHPEDLSEDAARVRKAMSGLSDAAEFEKRYITKDQRVVWTRIRSEIVRDSKGRPSFLINLLEDITDSKRLENQTAEREYWAERISNAIEQNRLVLYAQPILNMKSRKLETAELLVRMIDERDPSFVVPPGEFLPAAERHGLMGRIDLWVVKQAMSCATRARIAVNLSAQTVSDSDLVNEIERTVQESRVPAENVTFEITETAFAENMENAQRFVDSLGRMGCSFALDDFGVGFGTFSYLKYLPVDIIKIDIEFVRDLVNSPVDRQVVTAIIAAARLFDMKTVAEGVEDEPTFRVLEKLGVDYAQGFWVSKPGPIGNGGDINGVEHQGTM